MLTKKHPFSSSMPSLCASPLNTVRKGLRVEEDAETLRTPKPNSKNVHLSDKKSIKVISEKVSLHVNQFDDVVRYTYPSPSKVSKGKKQSKEGSNKNKDKDGKSKMKEEDKIKYKESK